MYTPLDPDAREIRVLQLSAGIKEDDINCELHTVSLDGVIEFEALSYVWGSPQNLLPITIEQETKYVTRNLESALRHIRYPDRSRTLWVDAVCINQDDIPEKNIQLRYMGNIYSAASQVLVWLGLGDDRNSKTIASIRKLAADRKLHWTDGELDLNLVNLELFLRNDWWSRIWTVQEAVLAKQITFQLGQWLISQSVMVDLMLSFGIHTSSRRCCDLDSWFGGKTHIATQNELRGLMNKMNHLATVQKLVGKETLPFDRLASEFRSRKATNPRDKVYGLLGISHGVRVSSIDYGLTPAQVFERTTRELLDYHGTLDLLSHCGQPVNSRRARLDQLNMTAGLPSWVPDWAVGSWSSGGLFDMIAYRLPFLNAYGACGHLRYITNNNLQEGILSLSGVICDSIKEVGGKIRQRAFFGNSDIIPEWRQMTGIDQDLSRPYIGGDTISNAFWRTLCVDISAMSGMSADKSANVQRAGSEDQTMYQRFWYMELLNLHMLPQPDFLREKEDIEIFHQHVLRTTTERQFFVSKKGYIGLAPSDTQAGDRICVFAGGRMPFIVRNLEEGNNEKSSDLGAHFRLLGDAYVHGLMDGEVVGILDDGSGKMETFHLH